MAQNREVDLTIEHVKEYISKPYGAADKVNPPVKEAPPVIPPTPKPPVKEIPLVHDTAPVQEKEAYLICERTGNRYHIIRASYVIGAGKNVDILTPDNMHVGRRHATLYKEGSKYYLVDENSLNGTRVNGEKLYPNEKFLLEGSVRIEFADEVYRFEIR